MTAPTATSHQKPLLPPRSSEDETLRALGWLSLGVAHDLNNLLTVVMGAASLASDKCTPAAMPEFDTINLACMDGRNLVKTLTGYFRNEDVIPEVIDVNQMIGKVLRFIPHASNGKVGFIQDLSPGSMLVSGHLTALTTALLNVLGNSLDAMPMGGVIILRTRNEGSERVSITIQDTGEGMSPATLARAMDPFFTTKPVGKGTGLGLALVRETVEHHRGALTISSEVGVGTIVRIDLPRAECAGSGPMANMH